MMISYLKKLLVKMYEYEIMYGYINGKITDIEASYVILENNGIGYLIYVPNPYGFMMERNIRYILILK